MEAAASDAPNLPPPDLSYQPYPRSTKRQRVSICPWRPIRVQRPNEDAAAEPLRRTQHQGFPMLPEPLNEEEATRLKKEEKTDLRRNCQVLYPIQLSGQPMHLGLQHVRKARPRRSNPLLITCPLRPIHTPSSACGQYLFLTLVKTAFAFI